MSRLISISAPRGHGGVLHNVRTKDQELTSKRRCRAKLIRFSEEELEIVVGRARSAGRPVACFVRDASMGSTPRMRRNELSDSLIHNLARLANRLAELSAVAKELDLPHASDFEYAVHEVLIVIRAID